MFVCPHCGKRLTLKLELVKEEGGEEILGEPLTLEEDKDLAEIQSLLDEDEEKEVEEELTGEELKIAEEEYLEETLTLEEDEDLAEIQSLLDEEKEAEEKKQSKEKKEGGRGGLMGF